MVLGWWCECYHHLWALEEVHRDILRGVLQQRCGALTKQSRKTYPANQFSSGLSAPESVEPETPQLGRSWGLFPYLQHCPVGHIQQDGVLQCCRDHAACFWWVHKQEFGGGARLVPLIQTHVSSTEGFRSNGAYRQAPHLLEAPHFRIACALSHRWPKPSRGWLHWQPP